MKDTFLYLVVRFDLITRVCELSGIYLEEQRANKEALARKSITNRVWVEKVLADHAIASGFLVIGKTNNQGY